MSIGGKMTLAERLMNRLHAKELINDEGIKKVLDIQKQSGGKVSDILLNLGLISKKDLTSVLCEELNIPAIDLSRFKISPDIIKLIPKKVAKYYNIVPVSRMGDVITVAMSDPLDVFALDDIKSLTGCDIGPVIATEKHIQTAITDYYENVSHESIEKIVENIKEDSEISLLEDAKEETRTQELIKLTQEAPVIKVANLLLADAVKMGASDILIEPQENDLRIRYRVDGILIEGKRLPKRIHNAVVSRLKVMSDLDIAEMRLPQDGRFKIKTQNKEVDFRMSVLPANCGEKVALRVLDKSQATLNIDSLGFDQSALKDMKKMADRPHGMILICGPTGCGKTTTLYSILKYVDAPEKNIVTVEDPVEYQLAGVNQVSVKTEIGLTFAGSLRSILRQDPDVIMIGEIRDFETVDIAIKSALTGHLVLSTLHTTSAVGSIIRMVNMGVEPFLITSSVLIVAAQRLLRKICPHCREQVKLEEVTAKILGLDPKMPVYRGKGCQTCQNTGYKGRVGIIETLVLTPEIKELIMERTQEHIVREYAKKHGMRVLRESAVEKLTQGVTTVEEVLRLTAGESSMGSGD